MSEADAASRPRPWRRRLAAFAAVVFCLVALDLARAPEHQLSARVLLVSIDVYQATLSRLLAKTGTKCRFHPSCSHFAEGAIRTDGALIGSLRALGRIARCGPWTPMGTDDPP